MRKRIALALSLLMVLCLVFSGCDLPISNDLSGSKTPAASAAPSYDLASIPAFSGNPYTIINDNQPTFTQDEITTESYEYYSPLDARGRCGYTMACLGIDLMPTEDRGSIGQVKPSGWHTVKYDCVDGKYLYNRCHLIGFQLSGENANEQNLITGTRYMNTEGMLPFENMVADYIKETENHVMYRVTPVFNGDNLVATGVIMEAYSVEDEGDGICFYVFCYNNQPGVVIDYATGLSALEEDGLPTAPPSSDVTSTYILNTNTKKFHLPSCSSVDDMSESNKQTYTGSRDELIEDGYSPCGVCKP